jgi:hypothetical protein
MTTVSTFARRRATVSAARARRSLVADEDHPSVCGSVLVLSGGLIGTNGYTA